MQDEFGSCSCMVEQSEDVSGTCGCGTDRMTVGSRMKQKTGAQNFW